MSKKSYSNSSKSRPENVSSGGRSIYCCIPGCGSSFYDNENNKTGIGFFRFPVEKNLRLSWIRAVNNVRRKGVGDNFKITEYTRICEFHFNAEDITVSMGIGRKKYKAGAVPKFKEIDTEKPKRRSPRKRISVNEDLLNDAMASCSVQPENEPEEIESLRMEIDNLKHENISLKNELENLKSKLNMYEKQSYSYENVSQNKKLFKSETGFEPENFETLYEFLNPGETLE